MEERTLIGYGQNGRLVVTIETSASVLFLWESAWCWFSKQQNKEGMKLGNFYNLGAYIVLFSSALAFCGFFCRCRFWAQLVFMVLAFAVLGGGFGCSLYLQGIGLEDADEMRAVISALSPFFLIPPMAINGIAVRDRSKSAAA